MLVDNQNARPKFVILFSEEIFLLLLFYIF